MITLNNLSKSYDEKIIFQNLNYKFIDGICYGIVGPNGIGKSVLLKLLVGYSRPDSGEIIIDNYKLSDEYKFIKNSGVTINNIDFIQNITGFENLMILQRINNSDIEFINYLIDKLELSGGINLLYKHFSTGMKQKLRIIQALMDKPDYLILDEPFSGLDSKSVEIARQIIIDYKKRAKNIFITSHIDEDIEIIADEVIDIRDLVGIKND